MKKKFVYRICLLFASIMLAGFLAFTAATVHHYARNTTRLRCSYERELIEKRASEFNNRLIQIGNVFSKAYLLNNDRISVADQFLEQPREADETLIEEFMQDVIGNNSYVYDIILVNTQTGRIYSKSKRSYWQLENDFDWKYDRFVQQVRGSSGIQISQLHPIAQDNHQQMVYTFGHNIQNMRAPGDTTEYGLILVNVLQKDFSPASYLRDTASPGHYVVLDRENQVFWGDSTPEENEQTAQRFLGEKENMTGLIWPAFVWCPGAGLPACL